MTPRATYRLQLGPGFGFAEAAALAPYLAALGVSHVYLPPVFAARPGSTHGYDVTDPGQINPELGGEAGFRAMAAAFRGEGLGLLLDIVPNHMGVWGADNRFWLDVLEWGAESRFAGWFDIDWSAHGGRLLAPVLGQAYGPALEAGALELRFDRAAGTFAVWAHGAHKLPVSPRHYGWVLAGGAGALEGAPPGDPGWAALKARLAAEPAEGEAAVAAFREPAALDGLIALQNWRPAKFSLERDALNYRRFFAISDLAGVRVEDAEVFAATQALPLALVREGLADGLRVDHVDGLRDPKAYLRRLRDGAGGPFWLLVEKILAPGERLPADWGADGTTGYEVANLLAGLLVDPAGEAAMTEGYRAFTGRGEAPGAVVREAKREVLVRMLGSEVASLTRRFLRLAEGSRRFRDLGKGAVRTALVETIAAFGVYRTYADAEGIGAADRERVAEAVAGAREVAAWLDPDAFDLVEAVLTLERGAWAEDEALEAALRLQQLSGPAMAKGLEDTALYRYGRLIALNEVGSEPGRFGATVAEFHAANAARQDESPLAMLTTSTHDTKRGEDARARIAALPRHAGAWAEEVAGWHALLHDPAAPIGRDEEYFFFQLLLGAWPVGWRTGVEPDAEARAAFAERVQAGMLKSVREAGEATRWIFGDPDYEARLTAFIDRALAPEGAFLRSFRGFEARLAEDGAANGLIQTALKLTMPGVPDIYRGAEAWEQSLVDPDNRRPLDYAALAGRLTRLPPGVAAFADWTAPEAKLALTARLLAARGAQPALFAEGRYEPLEAGPGHVSFRRVRGNAALVVLAALRHRDAAPAPRGDVLSGDVRAWRDVLRQAPAARDPDLRDLLAEVPVLVLLSA